MKTCAPDRVPRRTLAWVAPVAVVAIAAPAVAASAPRGVSNAEANYYWAQESQGMYARLEPSAGDLGAQYSTQVAYRADPWVSPPASGVLVLTVMFDQPVSLTGSPSMAWRRELPSSPDPAREFVFSRTPSAHGDALTFGVRGERAGSLTASTTMSLRTGGEATWSISPNSDRATLAD